MLADVALLVFVTTITAAPAVFQAATATPEEVADAPEDNSEVCLLCHRDRENDQIYDLPDDYEAHVAGKAANDEAVTEQATELELPGKTGWEYEE